ncbi:type 1 glutamine amidotransferase domain-containing protein [uncultured Tateyamaria sp.]|uniref:type 1 glutamine amidotransferase domain-containing protein n=1 Tax=uncultured Tateyamaria sp. TaxID=455651 RepID=UPI00260DA154|nr:type 1 glutamine amidotransferase domain-containing protein [uncultured Tateyamaria sp.]
MTHPKILMIATSADKLTNGEPTGVWLEELTTPYYAFVDGGADVTVASMAGGAIPVDARSVAADGDNDASVERYLKDPDLKKKVAETPAFDDIDTSGFDAVFLPGGHGTMFDYPTSDALASLIETFDGEGKVVSAVCHGPAGLVQAKTPAGDPFVKGKRVAGFTDSEEHAVGLQDAVPFLLETRLRELGAQVQTAPDFQVFAIRDGNLVTGQNPASAGKTAALVLKALSERAESAA